MATFIYVASVYLRGTLIADRFPVFAFSPVDLSGEWDGRWASAGAGSIGDLKNIEGRVAGARGIIVALPIPIALRLFGIKARFDRLQVFAIDNPKAPHVSPYTLTLDDVSVAAKSHIPKGTFKLEPYQVTAVPMAGGGSMAMFTPEGVTFSVAP